MTNIQDIREQIFSSKISLQGWTALHHAVNNRDEASAKILIAAGTSVNAQDNNVWQCHTS